MTTNNRNRGVFTPRELARLREQLDRETEPSETLLDREARAAAIICHGLAEKQENE